jgi:hypothetical protein
MPIIRNLSIVLNEEEVLRRQEIRDSATVQPYIMTQLRELLSKLDSFLEPAITYELYRIEEVQPGYLRLENGATFHGKKIFSILKQGRELAVAVCTIGPRLEEKVEEYLRNNESLKGLLLDGIGSAAVDFLAGEVCQLVKHEAFSRGYEASSPLGPGMHGWNIEEQRYLVQLVPVEQVGVHLTPNGMMVPRKSISMVIGIGHNMLTWSQAEACQRCNMKKTCRHKVHP